MSGPVLAVGSFDGVHLGHRAILDRALALARGLGTSAGVLTCEPLPAQLINPDFTFVLTPLNEKVELLVALGMDFVKVVRFDDALRRTPAGEFVEREILGPRPQAVVVGHDHRFGHLGRGDVTLLRRLLEARRVRLEVVPEFVLHDAPVRSTRIRERLLLGDVGRARELLGRPYRLSGPVETGTGTGTGLGFPTLNLAVHERRRLVPADGVYAALVEWLGSPPRPAAVNIGHRPTFCGQSRSIEAHVIDARVEPPPVRLDILFLRRLRPERRFPDPAALSVQIAEDVAAARRELDRERFLR